MEFKGKILQEVLRELVIEIAMFFALIVAVGIFSLSVYKIWEIVTTGQLSPPCVTVFTGSRGGE